MFPTELYNPSIENTPRPVPKATLQNFDEILATEQREPGISPDCPRKVSLDSIEACIRFSTLDECLAIAKGLSAGPAGYAITHVMQDSGWQMHELKFGVRVIDQVGTPDADCHLNGIRDSGIGRESVPSRLDAYLTTSTVLHSTRRM